MDEAKLVEAFKELAERAFESGKRLADMGHYREALDRYEMALKALELAKLTNMLKKYAEGGGG